MNCVDCNAHFNRSNGAIRCLPCAIIPRPRIAAPGRIRNGDLKSARVDGRIVCKDCLGPLELSKFSGKRTSLRCWACLARRRSIQEPIRQAAGLAVQKAIAAGTLQRPSAFPCKDCGRPAVQYDHRDYTKPLQVDPVCRSCNVMRGPAESGASSPNSSASPAPPEAPAPGAEAA